MDPFQFTPDSLEEIVFFLLPGFLFVQFFFFQIPDRKKSDLITVVWSVAASVFLTWLTGNIYNAINFITNIHTKLNVADLNFVYTKFIVMVISAVVLARSFKSKQFQKFICAIFNINVFPFGRIWNSFFHLPPNSVVKVFLKDGRVYVGIVIRASVDPNDEVQEVELWKPYFFNKETRNFTLIEETEEVLIQASAIDSIEKVIKESADELYSTAVYQTSKKGRKSGR